jgi:hypothetical protein
LSKSFISSKGVQHMNDTQHYSYVADYDMRACAWLVPFETDPT